MVTPAVAPVATKATASINSMLIPFDELKAETLDAVRNACRKACLTKAVELWGERQAVTIRDIAATDMGYTNNYFTNTSVTANAWAAQAVGSFTVATATVIGIYGIRLLVIHDGTIDFCPISAMRIEVGGARIAQWALQSLTDMTSATSTGTSVAYAGITKSPIVVAEDISVTMYEYTQTTGTVYDSTWIGMVVEKEGVTLKP